jgi:hypothetical protein
MASFLVLAPRSQNGRRDDDSTVFIRDGFAVLAFILPVPWLLVHRLWFEAALVLGLTIAISVVGDFTGHDDMAAFVTAVLSLLVGFEANNWRAAAVERRGYEQIAVVDARNADDAETTWFLGPNFAPGVTPSTPASLRSDTPSLPAAHKPALGGMVGLVSHRGEH